MDFYISSSQVSAPSRPKLQAETHASQPSQPRLRGVLTGTSALWALWLSRSRCAVAAKKEEKRKRTTRRRDAGGSRDAQPVILDGEDVISEEDGEIDISEEAEDFIWTRDAALMEAFEDIFLMDSLDARNLAVFPFLSVALRRYLESATIWQMQRLEMTWREANSARIRVPSDDILTGLGDPERLEEPLCWRSIPNDAGLDAFAADITVWAQRYQEIGNKASKRGFDSKSRKEMNLATRYTWTALKMIIQIFCKIFESSGMKPRILLSQGSIRRLKKDGVKDPEAELGIEVCTYLDKPSPEHLVSTGNSLVLVFLEPPVSADLLWSLPADIPERDRTLDYADTAPILMLSIHQLDVKFNMQGIAEKVQRWLMECDDLEEGDSTAQDDDIFAQWKSILPVPIPGFAGSRLEARRDYIRKRLGGLVRKVFANKRTKLRAERLPQLYEAQKRMTQQLRRQRELRAKGDIVLAELEEAIRKLDSETYEKKLTQAKIEQTLDKQKLQDIQQRWAKAVAAAEAPLQDLVQQCVDAELDQALLVLPRLQEELATSRLPIASHWLQAGLKLSNALEALELLPGAAAMESRTSSSASQPGYLMQLSQDIQNAETKLDGFERALKKARGNADSPTGTKSFQQVLKCSEQILTKSKNDQTLHQVLSGVPWERSKRLFAGFTNEASERLQAAFDAASESCRSRLKDALEEAFAAAAVAKRLRSAMEGHDEHALEEILLEAEQHGFLGLEGAQQQCLQMQTAKSTMRKELSDAASRLDIAAFDLASHNSALMAEEVQARREELQSAIREEERSLQEVLTSADAVKVAEVLRSCKLLAANPWRRVAKDSLTALEATKGIRQVLALDPVDETMLQASLSFGSAASRELSTSLQQVREPGDQDDLISPAFGELQRTLDEGYLGLAGARNDQALESLLNSPTWREANWEIIQPSDLRELELAVREASKEGQERLAQEVQRAQEVGQCAIDISNAISSWDLDKLETLFSKASDLKMLGLEKIQAAMQKIASRRARSSRSAIAPKVALQNPNAMLSRTLNNQSSSAGDEEARDVRCQNLIFLDLELTSGFYDFEDESRILEVAVIVTDKDMEELGRGHWVLGGFSRNDLENLGDFHKENFRDAVPGGEFPPLGPDGGNGLFSDVMASELTLEQVESEVMELIERHCPVGECPIVGYSVQCDREVIKDKMPRLYRHLSHQIIDVSGFFTVARYWLPDQWQDWDRKSTMYNHRALNDAEDSVEAMRWIRKKFFAPNRALKATGHREFLRQPAVNAAKDAAMSQR